MTLEALEAAPPADAFLLESFRALGSERSVGGMGGVSRIPFRAIRTYFECLGFADSMLDDYVEMILEVDEYWHNHIMPAMLEAASK